MILQKELTRSMHTEHGIPLITARMLGQSGSTLITFAFPATTSRGLLR